MEQRLQVFFVGGYPEGIGVLLVAWVVGAFGAAPCVEGREEGIGLFRHVVDDGEQQLVGLVEQLRIDGCAADDVHLLVVVACVQCLVKRGIAFGTIDVPEAAAHHDVAAVGQSSFGQRVEGLPTHQHGMSAGGGTEVAHVVGQAIEQCIVVAQCAVVGDGGNEDEWHISADCYAEG